MRALLVVCIFSLSLSGCAAFSPVEEDLSTAEKRKAGLKRCVKEFLAEDVNPKTSFEICDNIYKRWMQQ